MEGFPRGAFAACEGGGLAESLPAPWGVFRVCFRGVKVSQQVKNSQLGELSFFTVQIH